MRIAGFLPKAVVAGVFSQKYGGIFQASANFSLPLSRPHQYQTCVTLNFNLKTMGQQLVSRSLYRYMTWFMDINIFIILSITVCMILGLFGQGPWLLPVYHFVQNPRYLPAAKPTDSSLTTMPFNVAITSDEMTLISGRFLSIFLNDEL